MQMVQKEPDYNEHLQAQAITYKNKYVNEASKQKKLKTENRDSHKKVASLKEEKTRLEIEKQADLERAQKLIHDITTQTKATLESETEVARDEGFMEGQNHATEKLEPKLKDARKKNVEIVKENKKLQAEKFRLEASVLDIVQENSKQVEKRLSTQHEMEIDSLENEKQALLEALEKSQEELLNHGMQEVENGAQALDSIMRHMLPVEIYKKLSKYQNVNKIGINAESVGAMLLVVIVIASTVAMMVPCCSLLRVCWSSFTIKVAEESTSIALIIQISACTAKRKFDEGPVVLIVLTLPTRNVLE